MTSFAASSLKLLRRVLGGGAVPPPAEGTETVVDGLTAVALTEAVASDTAALGATFPAAAAARAWTAARRRWPFEEPGRMLGEVKAESPRGALAAAMGASLSGERATVFLSGPDMLGGIDLLTRAAGGHLPLVVHLAARAAAGHGVALGSGHEAYHAAAGTGWLQLFALNVQEAVDLALVARQVAERALVPALVAMDAEQTALAAQDVRLPGRALVGPFLGEAHDTIDAPTDAQRLIFGAVRRRVPRWYDLERPLLIGPLMGPESWALGAAGRSPYFEAPVADMLSEAFEHLATLTGRRYRPLVEHALQRAEIVLVAQGAAVETAAATADVARRQGLKVGVIGVRCLRPFPRARMAAALDGAKVVVVLERVDGALAGDGPLLNELHACVARGRKSPRLVGVPFGLGGLPLRVADLLALLGALGEAAPDRVYLGLEFTRNRSAYPKHQALLDALRRSDPGLETLGLRSEVPAPDVRPPGAVTIALARRAGSEREALAGEAAALLHALLGGAVRSRPALTWQRSAEPCADELTLAAAPLRDPGDDVPVDVAVGTIESLSAPMIAARLAAGGTVLAVTGLPDETLVAALPAPLQHALAADECTLYAVSPADDTDGARTEATLGGLVAAVLRRRGDAAPSTARIRGARETQLGNLEPPAHDERLDAFVAAFDSLRRIAPGGAGAALSEPAADAGHDLPAVIRRRGRGAETLESLPRFWDHAGVLYRDGRTDELVAEPGLAAGAMPPLTAALRDLGTGAPDMLVAFDPATCDGDPALWTSCPDGSVAPLVISARALLDAGIDLAARSGRPVDALRSVAGQLARAVNRTLANAEPAPTTAGELLHRSFATLRDKLDPERAATLSGMLLVVSEEIGALPVARTTAFFDEPEREQPGSGELFSLAVDPDACRSPEVVLAAAGGHGLVAVPRTVATVESARRLWTLWEKLPDTSGATIARARARPGIGALAACLLSRHCAQTMAGADDAEVGSGAKLALRRVLAVAEWHYQPRLQKHLDEIGELRGRLGESIRSALAEALPSGDLDALAEGLTVLGRGDLDLADLSKRIDTAVSGGRVDGARLGRLVDVARGLADLEWHIRTGPCGLGRARVGLALAAGHATAWAAAFPYQSLTGPAVVDAVGEGAALARGLLEGQLRRSLAGVRLLRWARLELENPDGAEAAARKLFELRFADLTEPERGLCPPILLVGDDHALSGRGLSTLVWLLDSGLPVKVVCLSDIGGGADTGLGVDALAPYPAAGRLDLGLLAQLTGKAFVAQASPAYDDHFARSVEAALAFDGPALVVIHAPSPQRHGFAPARLLEQARLAVRSRAFCLLTFDPGAEGVFGSRLDLAGNPEPAALLVEDDGRRLTPVDWAATEGRFAEHLRPLRADDPAPVPVGEHLAAAPDGGGQVTPFVTVGDERRWISAALLEDAGDRLRLWRTLQELAGIVTPFTEKVRGDVERDLGATHAAAMTQVKAECEARLATVRDELEAETTERVAQGLLALVAAGSEGGVGGLAS